MVGVSAKEDYNEEASIAHSAPVRTLPPRIQFQHDKSRSRSFKIVMNRRAYNYKRD